MTGTDPQDPGADSGEEVADTPRRIGPISPYDAVSYLDWSTIPSLARTASGEDERDEDH